MADIEQFLSAECALRTLPADRLVQCAKLAADIVQQWWHGDLTLELQEVATDFRFTDRPAITEQEWDLVYDCMAEHASSRCQALVHSPLRNILDSIEE